MERNSPGKRRILPSGQNSAEIGTSLINYYEGALVGNAGRAHFAHLNVQVLGNHVGSP
jgi:hypothetical protein